MAYILNIETSTTNCSVSLSKDGTACCLIEDNSGSYSHAERLHVYIEQAFQSEQIQTKDLQAIAVSKGPGSYTGLRIGVSAAKGLCFSQNIPLIAIPTLEILAHKTKIKKGFIVPALDARRMEVYSAVFDQALNEIKTTSANILDHNSFQDLLASEPVCFIGNASDKLMHVIKHPNANFISELPSAQQMCDLSYRKFLSGTFEDLAYFEPYYLKDFIAIPSKKN